METIIRSYIAQSLDAGRLPQPLDDDASLVQSGLLDSLAVLKLISFLEERFDISVSEHDLIPSNFESVRRICAFVQSRQQ